jgi:hypothetical protein
MFAPVIKTALFACKFVFLENISFQTNEESMGISKCGSRRTVSLQIACPVKTRFVIPRFVVFGNDFVLSAL